MTTTEPTPAGIPTISNQAEYPRCLTDRFGDWNITGPWSDAPPSSVDPRSFMGSNDTTFVARWKDGVIGILSEVESNFYLDPDWLNEEYDRALFTIEGYVELKKKIAVDLAALQKMFEHSKVFFAEGGVTFDGRLTLCAFTPLVRATDADPYSSPYGVSTPTAIETLDSALMDVLDEVKIDPSWLRADLPAPMNNPFHNAPV